MALILQRLLNGYNYVFEDLADPRVKHLFLMSSPFPILAIIGFYLYFVLKLGPRLMKNRARFNLEKILVVYNLIQIVTCGFLVIQSLRYTFFKYSLICEPIDYSNSELPVKVSKYVWIYFILKVIDLLDTVFFILRKKNNQVTFLHIYHHAMVCVFTWLSTKYIAGGHGVFLGFLNCIVHTVMYFYYLLTAWDKKYKKNIWWKKHLTQLQLAQFVILFIYFGQILFQPKCTYPKLPALFCCCQNVIMIVLFANFYNKNYRWPQEKSKTENGKIRDKLTTKFN